MLVLGWVTALVKYASKRVKENSAGSYGWELLASYSAADPKIMWEMQRVLQTPLTISGIHVLLIMV